MKLRLSALLALLPLTFMACQEGGSTSSTDIVRPLDKSTVIMEFKDGKITAGDLEAQVGPELAKMNGEAIEAYKRGAQRALTMKLLEAEAKKQGLKTPDELMAKITSEGKVPEEAVTEFMKANKLDKPIKDPRTGQTRKVSREEVTAYLNEQERNNRQQSFLSGLMASAGVKMKLEEPRVNVIASGNEPFKGGKNAKVVIHEFSDFECPFCSRGKGVVDQIASTYGDKVKIVFRQFPLESRHPNAKPAAIAALCANKQDKFWAMHDKLFDNQRDLASSPYKGYAKELGLDQKSFDECLANPGDVAKQLADDLQAAEKMGVDSTPTFFINGKRVAGALPFDQFRSIIDQELGN